MQVVRRSPGSTLFVLAALLLSVAALGALYHAYFRPDPWPDLGQVDDVREDDPLAPKVLLFCSDSVRSEVFDDRELMPYFGFLADRGISGTLTVPGPTLTGVSVTSFGTGTTPPLATAMTNFVVPPWGDEDVFRLARRRGWKTAFFGDDTWFRAFGEGASFDDTFYFSDFKGGLENNWYGCDLQSLDAAEHVLPTEIWQLAAVHVATTDKLAHLSGAHLKDPKSGALSAYARAAHAVDQRCERLVRMLGSDTAVFFFSDHGCTVSGTHGSYDLETRQTRFAAAGPGIRRIAERVDLDATEMAALIARLLGMRAPRCAESPLRHELIELDETESRAAHRRNLVHRLAFLEALADRSDVDWESPARTAVRAVIEKGPTDGTSAADLAVLQRRLNADLARHLDLARLRSKIFGIGAVLFAFFLLTFAYGRMHGPGSTWWSALTGTALFIALAAWYQMEHGWVYNFMRRSETLAGSDGLAALGGAAFLLAIGRRLKGLSVPRLADSWRAASSVLKHLIRRSGLAPLAAPLAVVLIGSLAMSWPYGPNIETSFVATLLFMAGLFAFAPERRSATRRDVAYAVFAVILLTLLYALGRRWISGDVENIYRVADSLTMRLLGIAFFAALALVALASTDRRAAAGEGPRPSGLGTAVVRAAPSYLLFAFALYARDAGEPKLGIVAVGLYAALLLALLMRRPKDTVGLAAARLLLASAALHRLFAGDADFLMFLMFATIAWCWGQAAYAMRRPYRTYALGGLVLLDLAYFFSQGYAYKLSTFDMNAAFTLQNGALNLGVAAVAILLQHSAAEAVLVAAAVAGEDGAGDGRSTPGPGTALAFFWVSRVVCTFIVLPAFEHEGWIFLRSVHYQFFEAAKLGLLAVFLLVVYARRPSLTETSP